MNLRAQVDAVRGFNRFYTRRIGVLTEELLQSPFTLTEARVLFELAHATGSTAKEIGDSLRLDPGYMSRIVQEFALRRLVTRARSRRDARQVALTLTSAGRRAFAKLDESSHRATARMLERLAAPELERLVEAMNEVQSALDERPPEAPEILLRAPRPGDIGWAIERHGQLYAEEHGWNVEFEALVAKLFADFASRHDPGRERLWIAEIEGKRVGCVFVVRNEHDPSAAQLRCLLVDSRGRRKGVGRRLVRECIAFASAAGYEKLLLWTNSVLVAARRLYESEGFELLARKRHRSFGHALVGQTWMRRLN